MQISIIVAHPQRGSFNYAIALICLEQLQKNGHLVVFHDLYAESFDPVLPADELDDSAFFPELIELHCNEIALADGIIIVHPNWWGQPPAILKGWIDRVFRAGIAYKFLEHDSGEGIPVGLLKAKVAIVFNTSNTPAEREIKVFEDPLETLWRNSVFGLCGVTNFHRDMFRVIVTSSPEQRQAWLDKVRDIMNQFFPREEL
jgi:NAD(P)H dehydrogenase (quinone)